MLIKTHSTRHAGGCAPVRHAYPVAVVKSADLVNRMRACVSQDRMEAIAAPDPELLMSVVNEESQVIRSSLGVCERIAQLMRK